MDPTKNSTGHVGYSNREALHKLHRELVAEIESYEQVQNSTKWTRQFHMLHPSNIRSTFHWTSVAYLVIVSCGLLASFVVNSQRADDNGYGWFKVEFVVYIISLIINVWFSLWNARLDERETVYLARLVLKQVEEFQQQRSWNVDSFLNLYSPLSPCVSLQWTIRDGVVINLPTQLLTEGDIIVLRPGQMVPAKCKQLKESQTEDKQDIILNEEEVFATEKEEKKFDRNLPQGKTPLTPHKFVLLETPFTRRLRSILQDKSKCPISLIETERYHICVWIERRIVPAVVLIMLVVNSVRYMYLSGHVGEWAETILVLTIHSVLPLMPLLFPLFWRLLNYYGQARVFAALQVAKHTKVQCEDSFSSDSDISEDEAKVDIQWSQVAHLFWEICLGRANMVVRRVNVAHILGSVTSLCCVDKKGILSWPNPSAEKIFVLSSGSRRNSNEEDENMIYRSGSFSKTNDEGFSRSESSLKGEKNQYTGHEMECHVEVLDLTHYTMNAFGLHFDDPTWKKHLSSLKPLGLNILANTCNDKTVEWYTRFTDHVASEALENEETVAVVNRRCLCELAKQIGFTEQALDIFSMDKVLGLYRQVSPEEAAKEKSHRAKSFVHHKIPMPNMVSVVMKEKISGSSQILSQGTADILLDCCSDYWNGEDVCTLTENNRKKILDFYHRTSMASYCTAFSYRPLTQSISPHLCEVFMMLPHHWSHAHNKAEKSGSLSSEVDFNFESHLWKDSRAISMDSLFDNTSISSVEDVAGCCQAQSNQVFIGMVTMQYQARQDFVQLIDKLEVACIRFVHFSQENEVRSRVFSEKIGLEAGWNCHISLQSTSKQDVSTSAATAAASSVSQAELCRTASQYSSRHSSETGPKDPLLNNSQDSLRCRYHSAPSIVNLDSAQVRFQMNVSETDASQNSTRPRICSESRSTQVQHNNDNVFVMDSETAVSETTPLTSKSTETNSPNFEGVTDGESRHTSSYFTEDSLTGALDNRAQLPRGIENIRPHLEKVDNVPLLVNLFTDCTTEATQEMMKIMQEHGEVVMCVGSSLNMDNINLFLQADCSIAVEPLYPVVCAKSPVMLESWDHENCSPMDIASGLVGLSCPIQFKQSDTVGLIQLIAEARTFLLSLRNCFYLMVCYHLSVTLVQVFASVLLFPPVLASQHLLWLNFIVIPLLSLSMMGNELDFRVMNNATSKNPKFVTKEMILQFICYFSLRFLPSILISLLCYGLTLQSYCMNIPDLGKPCAVYDFSVHNATVTWYDKFSGGIVIAQNVSLFFLVLYFVSISVTLVHWSDHLWQQFPFTNKLWTVVAPVIVVLQCVYFACDTVIRNLSLEHTLPLSDIHPVVYLTGFCFPGVIILINELVKRREVKLYARYQKRTRLNFGTKLGMNSPF